MNVTIFGGSAPKPDEPAYQEALRLGARLAGAGHTVLTGGYMGTMEAVSRGAKEAGGHVIGITCTEIETWRQAKANPWVIEERSYPTLRERLYALIDDCDAAMALPGGIGTLAEIASMWSQMQTASSPTRPLILIGEGWKATIQTMLQHLPTYVPEAHRPLISYAMDVDEAASSLEALLAD
jgi:hypothetical protein